MFPTLCKIYEMVLLNRLENYVSQKGLFYDMQFGFKEGVGCTEASFTGQGRILAPFMYKVYMNGLLNVLTNHCYSISVNRLSLPSPSFADDVTLLALYPISSTLSWRCVTNKVSNGDMNSIT